MPDQYKRILVRPNPTRFLRYTCFFLLQPVCLLKKTPRQASCCFHLLSYLTLISSLGTSRLLTQRRSSALSLAPISSLVYSNQLSCLIVCYLKGDHHWLLLSPAPLVSSFLVVSCTDLWLLVSVSCLCCYLVYMAFSSFVGERW